MMRQTLILLASTLLAAAAFADGPPAEPGPFLKPDPVELVKLDPSFKLDIRYASKNNFLGRPVYPEARAFLQRSAAEALARVQQALKKRGLGLLIFDGYRPWSVTKIFWDETPADKHEFVADPAKGSRHNRGCAVDLTLVDLRTGAPLAMPSDYDEMNEKAHPDYAGGDPAAREHRDTLRKAMEAEGFSIYPNEWWHFDFHGWEQYALMDLSFSEVAAMNQPLDKKVDPGFTWPVPAGWKSETIPFPLDFARALRHKGVEEIRFTPGFFNPDAPDFWSYAFVWWLEDEPPHDSAALGKELEKYFHGLCVAVGREKKIDCARKRFKARLEPALSAANLAQGRKMSYIGGTLESIDPFKTGKPVTLHLHIRLFASPPARRHVMLVAISAKPAGDPVWSGLMDAVKSFQCP